MAGQIRQLGILKAIGASRFQLFRIYISMLLVIGALSGLILKGTGISVREALSDYGISQKAIVRECQTNQQAMELYNNPPLGSTLPLRVRDKTINSSCYAVFRQTHAG